jgi:hypothetical protein
MKLTTLTFDDEDGHSHWNVRHEMTSLELKCNSHSTEHMHVLDTKTELIIHISKLIQPYLHGKSEKKHVPLCPKKI